MPPSGKEYTWHLDPEEPAKSGTGAFYCSQLESAARTSAQKLSWFGWTFAVAAVGTAATPAIIAASSGDKLEDGEKAVAVGMPVLSALFALASLSAFQRSDHASEVANEATLAMEVEAPASVCNKALADWHGSRGDASKAMRDRIEQQVKEELAAEAGQGGAGAAIEDGAPAGEGGAG